MKPLTKGELPSFDLLPVPNYFFTREIVALEEGAATDADLKRPD